MKKVVKKILLPLESFVKTEASSGIILAICTIIALALANSPVSEQYHSFLHIKILGLSIHHWINDGLMALFFFVVGMEIKRELLIGELSTPKQAALPIVAAIGGMVGPALIYYILNPEYPNVKGWGIPMATDIAFAVGVLSFFGKRVPFPLKIFLLALAIVDDLGAVLVIAFFYSKGISGPYLGFAALAIGAMVLIKRMGIRNYAVYWVIGAVVWFMVLKSGVHATIAGVLIGLLTPLEYPREKGSKETYSPLQDMIHHLHPYVSYGIMPIFALANAGVTLGDTSLSYLISNSIHQGVGLGLFIGKPIGILIACSISVWLGFAKLPNRVNWLALTGVGCLAGIGFTMALFISSLALYPEQEIYSKTGILLGSLASTIVGAVILWISFCTSDKNENT